MGARDVTTELLTWPDYGEKGGPGHDDCMACRYKYLAEDDKWWSATTGAEGA